MGEERWSRKMKSPLSSSPPEEVVILLKLGWHRLFRSQKQLQPLWL